MAIKDSQLLGFLIARKFPAPPVYAPSSDTYLVDDFAVLEPRHPPGVGEAPPSHASTLMHEAGAVQIERFAATAILPRPNCCAGWTSRSPRSWWTKPSPEKLQLEGQAPLHDV